MYQIVDAVVSRMCSVVEIRLVEAFEDSLVKYGWHGTTMARIAALAESSRMTLHRRGVTKESLLQMMSARLEFEHREALWPAVTSASSGIERLEQALLAECALTEHHLALLEALDSAQHAALYHDESPSGSRYTYIKPYERILLDGVTDGSIRGLGSVTDTATLLFTSLGLTYRHLRHGHRWSAARCRSILVEAALAGVRP